MEGKKITLHYFNLNCKGIILRLLLKYGNIQFEDKRVSFEEWGSLKSTFDFKFMPVLEIDGVQHSQAYSLYVYVARKIGGLLGKTAEEEQEILCALLCLEDINSKIVQKELKLVDETTGITNLKNTVLQIVSGLEILYKRLGKGEFFIGDSLSLADFFLVAIFKVYLFGIGKEFLKESINEQAPNLSNLVERLISSDLFVKLLKEVEIPGVF